MACALRCPVAATADGGAAPSGMRRPPEAWDSEPTGDEDALPSKAAPGGLSSKKGRVTIFPPNSQPLQVARHDAYLPEERGA